MNEITRRRFLQFIGGGAGAVAFSSLFFRPIWASIPAFRPVSSSLLGVDRNGCLCHLAPFGFCLIVLSMDQTAVRERHEVLMVSLGYGDRALPLYWYTQAGEGNIGYEAQEGLLDQVRAWLPSAAKVMLLGDRFFGSPDLIRYYQRHGWGYRLRLKGNLLVDTGRVSTTTGELAQGVPPRGLYLTDVLLTGQEVPTNLGLLHEAGHEEAWIIAMDAIPTHARVLD